MNPIIFAIHCFENQLVEVTVVHDPGEPVVEDVHVGVGFVVIPLGIGGLGDLDVDCLAKGVLRGIDTTDLDIELGTAVATADDDRLACEGTEGLEDLLAEQLESWDILSGAGVVDAIGLGSG